MDTPDWMNSVNLAFSPKKIDMPDILRNYVETLRKKNQKFKVKI